jgi:hypothetical protein
MHSKWLLIIAVMAGFQVAPSARAEPMGNGSPVTTVQIQFTQNDATFRPSAEAGALLAHAADAALVVVRGRTSATLVSAKDEALALARASAARAYLIAQGVSPLKINVNWVSAADFTNTGASADARAQNARVEIDLFNGFGVMAFASYLGPHPGAMPVAIGATPVARFDSESRPGAQRTGVQAGSAAVEQALAQLVPAQYRVKLDQSIPKTTVLTWADQGDWVGALRQAALGARLRVDHDMEQSLVMVSAVAPSMPIASVQTPTEGVRVAAPASAVPTGFHVTPADKTLREALVRWSKQASWVHEPVHWTPGFDLPITASSTFGGDYKVAVRGLLSVTEMGGAPLQPCFYSNRVLRVVPKSELCDRTTQTQNNTSR